MKRLWIVSELYYPEESATGYFVTHIAEGLARRFPVSVICCQPTYSSRGVKAAPREMRRGVNVYRCWSTTFPKDNLLLRIFNIVTICSSLFWKAFWNARSEDVIMVVTNPPFLPALISFAAYLRNARCILLTHDVYPDALASVGFLRKDSAAYNISDILASKMFRSMDKVFVLGRDMEELVKRHLDGSLVPVQVIPNWADTETVMPLSREDNSLLRELGLTSNFVIQYSGNMGRTHDIETIVEAARRLRDQPDIAFLFIGWGAKEHWLRRTIENEKLRNVVILSPRPRDEIHISLNACDLAIISFISGMAGVSVPSRMYNMMSAGKPLLAAADKRSEVARVITDLEIGVAVEPENPGELVAAILALKGDRERLNAMSRRARKAAEDEYSEGKILERYAAALCTWLEKNATESSSSALVN